jgi:glycosyltransferase involved in cell wall biosynthesis
VKRDIFFVGNSVSELGGVTSWTHQMARLLTGRGHHLHVVGITEAGVEHRLGDQLPYPTTTLYEDRPAADRRKREEGMAVPVARLTELFRAARPGAVLVVTQVWAMEWVARADTSGLTVIGMSHESFKACRASSRFRRVQTYYKDVDRMLALTQEDSDLWIRQGLQNASFMPNPLPIMPELPSPRAEKTVLSLGRLSDEKGVDILLDTWAEVAPLHPDWTLRIYGAGEDAELLRKQCTGLGLDDSVVWMGRTDDVAAAMRGGSVFALTSRAEGFPLALLEAMASAVPCVSFDCAPGVREIIRDGEDGLVAALGNTGELARHLDLLISDRELRERMGDAARENVQRFGAEEILDRWEALFDFLDR